MATTVRLLTNQLEVLDKLRTGSILYGGVGSGKSLTSIGYYFVKVGGGVIPTESDDRFEPMKKKINLYIITTARKRDTREWEKELAAYKLYITPEDNHTGNKVVIDSWNNITKYKDVQDAFFIFDEQRVVGYGAWVKSFLKIAKKNEWILLSATPGDVWTDYAPVFIANGFYRNKTQFFDDHVVFDNFVSYPKIKKYVDVKTMQKHKDAVLVRMAPTRNIEKVHSRLTADYNKEDVERLVKDRWNIFEDQPIKNASELFFNVRRVINSNESRIRLVDRVHSKHPRLIIFYNFNYELDMLREYCDSGHIEYAEWNGQKHEPIPESNRWIYLVQYTAGAEGWNCISTDTVLFFSQTYSYKLLHQAQGRVDRMNSPYSTLYYIHITSDAKLDSRITQALRDKKVFNERDISDLA